MATYQSSAFSTATGYAASGDYPYSTASLQLGYFGFSLGTALLLTTASMTVPSAQSIALVTRQTTNSGGLAIDLVEAPHKAVMELRRLSGLTWDQLGQIFGVTRRTLHFWASGQPLALENERALRATLALLKAYDRGSAALNREVLLLQLDGRTTLELLQNGRYGEVVERFAARPSAAPLLRAKVPVLAVKEDAATKARLALNVMLNGRQDLVSEDNPQRRAAAPIKKRKST